MKLNKILCVLISILILVLLVNGIIGGFSTNKITMLGIASILLCKSLILYFVGRNQYENNLESSKKLIILPIITLIFIILTLWISIDDLYQNIITLFF